MNRNEAVNMLATIERKIRDALRKDVSADIDVSMSRDYIDVSCNEEMVEKVKDLLAKVPNLRMVGIMTDEGQACLLYSY